MYQSRSDIKAEKAQVFIFDSVILQKETSRLDKKVSFIVTKQDTFLRVWRQVTKKDEAIDPLSLTNWLLHTRGKGIDRKVIMNSFYIFTKHVILACSAFRADVTVARPKRESSEQPQFT